MRVRTMLVGLAGLTAMLAVSIAWAGQSRVRAIEINGLDLGDVRQGDFNTPRLITSADELYDTIRHDEAIQVINGKVDFTKENLLYFRWVGSGDDRLGFRDATSSRNRVVTFVLTPGMTLDLWPHRYLFAVPKDSTWQVEMAIPTVP